MPLFSEVLDPGSDFLLLFLGALLRVRVINAYSEKKMLSTLLKMASRARGGSSRFRRELRRDLHSRGLARPRSRSQSGG
jgi:hypothetical protein